MEQLTCNVTEGKSFRLVNEMNGGCKPLDVLETSIGTKFRVMNFKTILRNERH
ncbi:MAG: hypothetical protein ACTS5F_01215 [Candidatus Hodgkinia cicadicola]